MSNLVVDERDARFILYEQLNIEDLCQSEKYAEYSREMFDMILDAADKLVENELWPCRTKGDIEGVRLRDGIVEVPESFHEVYQHFCEGGWISLLCRCGAWGSGMSYHYGVRRVRAFCGREPVVHGLSGSDVGSRSCDSESRF